MKAQGRARMDESEAVARLGVAAAELRLWCRSGWLAPADGERGPVFDELDLARARLVHELRDDLGLDDGAVPVVLSLLDQLYGLRCELRTLAQAVEQQEEEVAARIRAAYRALSTR